MSEMVFGLGAAEPKDPDPVTFLCWRWRANDATLVVAASACQEVQRKASQDAVNLALLTQEKSRSEAQGALGEPTLYCSLVTMVAA